MTHATRRVAVVGSSVAAMMATLTLAEEDWHVTLITPTAKLGGHFAGLSVAGHLFDAGMVFLEFTAFNASRDADLATYQPGRRNDAGRFVSIVEQTLSRFGNWRTVEAPQMRIGDQIYPDMLIANALTALAQLPTPLRAQMARELADARGNTRAQFHPRHKTTDPEFAQYDLETVSVANHGYTFHHEFIEPFCRKVTAGTSASLAALYHRMAWLPLYYPETLASALAGEPPSLPDTRFSYPTSGTIATLVHQLEAQIRAMPQVRVLAARIDTMSTSTDRPVMRLAPDETVTVDRVVWAAEPESLLALSGLELTASLDRASLTLASVLVKASALRDAFSTLLLPEETHWPFRITNQSRAAGQQEPMARLSCEWNSAFLTGDADAMATRTRDALVELGVVARADDVADVRVHVFRDALPLPSPANIARSLARSQRLDSRLPTVPRIGPAAPFGATSLNDQIIQGLKVGRELEVTA
ncbi:MAG: hypothetical protein ABMA00_06715 [Gemmatimonas sp.]